MIKHYLAEGVSRRKFLSGMGAVGITSIAASGLELNGVTALAQGQSVNLQKPNVVLILLDDIGYGDLHSYGNPDIRSPNTDRLAKEGVRLTDFYANAPVCSPTRAALMTGRYQQRVGIERVLGPRSVAMDEGLRVTGRSLPQLLKNNGYKTALVGKWHLGYKPEYAPNAHGFDYFFGFLGAAVDYYSQIDQEGYPDLWENGNLIKESGYMTDLITERSVRFIDQNATRPFYLEVAYNAAHEPFQRPDHPSVAYPSETRHYPMPSGLEDNPPKNRSDYVAMLERADEGIGQILKALESHDLTKNTIVIFTNDNGGQWLSRNAPLFHWKFSLWEGGIRVPCIVRWPGHIPAGKTSAQVGITMDLTASILAATNSPVPPDMGLDGIDLLPVLRGEKPVMERTLFWRYSTPARMQKAVRKGEWKDLLDGETLFLFDLPKDVGERNDLLAAQPALGLELYHLILAWEKDVDSGVKPQGQHRSEGTKR